MLISSFTLAIDLQRLGFVC